MALDSHGETQIIVEYEKGDWQKCCHEWMDTPAGWKDSQPGCLRDRTTLGSAVALWDSPSSNLSRGVQSATKPKAYESMQGVLGTATGRRKEPVAKRKMTPSYYFSRL